MELKSPCPCRVREPWQQEPLHTIMVIDGRAPPERINTIGTMAAPLAKLCKN